VAGRKEIIADVARGPVGVVDDPTVSPEAEARDSLKRVTPAKFLHRLLAVATHDGIHAGTGGKPVLGILRHVPAAQKDEGPRPHGADLLADEFDVAFPVHREADQVRPGTAEIDGAAGSLPEIHDLQRSATRLQNRRDQLKPQRGEEPRMEPVVAVGVNAEDMVIY